MEETSVAGSFLVSEGQVVVWQAGVTRTDPVRPGKPPSIHHAGRDYPAGHVASSAHQGRHVYLSVTSPLPVAEVSDVATSDRVLFSASASVDVTLNTGEGPLRIIGGTTTEPYADWTDDEYCLWRESFPDASADGDNWWIHAYLVPWVDEPPR